MEVVLDKGGSSSAVAPLADDFSPLPGAPYLLNFVASFRFAVKHPSKGLLPRRCNSSFTLSGVNPGSSRPRLMGQPFSGDGGEFDDADIVWYNCGGGWAVAVHPSQGYAIKLVHIKTHVRLGKISFIPILCPPLPPYKFFHRHLDYEDLEYDEILKDVKQYESIAFAKFILHVNDGDDPTSGDFTLVALFSKHLDSNSVQAAAFFSSSSSSSSQPSDWVPIVDSHPLLDAVIQGDQLWTINCRRELSCFPLIKSTSPSPSTSGSGGGGGEGGPTICPSVTYDFPEMDQGTGFERPFDMLYLLLDDHHPNNNNKMLAVVRSGYDKLVGPGARPESIPEAFRVSNPKAFRVYELSLAEKPSPTARELSNLGNRALFLGDNVSFFVEANNNNNATPHAPRPNCIYFADHFFDWNLERRRGKRVPMDMGVYDYTTSQVITGPSAPTFTAVATKITRPLFVPIPVPQWVLW